jgi:putative ABC transport system substrate-binding protein
MKRIILLLILGITILVFLANHLPSQSKNVFAIASKNAQFYTDPLEGFKRSCTHNITGVILSENEQENMRNIANVKNGNPDLVFLIGSYAASSFDFKSTNVPVVYCMILDPEGHGLSGPNVTGVSLDVPVSAELSFLKTLVPNVRRIGLLYNPQSMQKVADDLARETTTRRMELFTAPVNSSAEIANALKGFKDKDKIEALYLPMDSTLLEKRTFEYINLFSIQNRIALLTPTAKFVKMGGLMAADVDLQGIGRQAGTIANRILAGTSPSSIPPENPHEVILALNSRAASLIGITIPPTLMNSAVIYNK